MKVVVCNDMDWLYSDEAFSIYSSCMYQPAYEDYNTQMRKYISDSSVKIFVCEEFGKKEGILVLGQSDSDPEIVGIAVSDNCQRCGIGRYMIYHVMELEHLRNIKAQTDDDAIGFYCKYRTKR